MAISSPRVIQGQNQIPQGLFQLANTLQQSQQMNQQKDQFEQSIAIDAKNRELERQDAINRFQAEQQAADLEFQRKSYGKLYEGYKANPRKIINNPEALTRGLEAAIISGELPQDATKMDFINILDETATLGENRLAWDKWKWVQEFDFKKQQALKESGLEMDPRDAGEQKRIDGILTQIYDTPTEEREKLIKEKGWLQTFENYNINIADKYGFDRINTKITDTGDWKFWTPREKSVEISGGEKYTPPTLTLSEKKEALLRRQMALGGDAGKEARRTLEEAGKDVGPVRKSVNEEEHDKILNQLNLFGGAPKPVYNRISTDKEGNVRGL